MTDPTPSPTTANLSEAVLLWGSTPAEWLAAAGGIASLVIAAMALYHSRRTAEPRVEWLLDRGERHRFRLVQVGADIEAVVDSIDEVSEGNALLVHTPAPRTLGHGAAIILSVSRSGADAFPTEVMVQWRSAKPGERPGRRVHNRIFALD